MKTLLKTALVALTLTVGAATAQAHTIWRFPYKGAPYAVPHEHNRSVSTPRIYERRDTHRRLWCAQRKHVPRR